MKAVLRQVEVEEKKVYVEDLTEKDFVGLKISGYRFALSRTKQGYEYIGDANLLSSDKCNYLNLKDALDSTGSLFVFDSAKELFKWISE